MRFLPACRFTGGFNKLPVGGTWGEEPRVPRWAALLMEKERVMLEEEARGEEEVEDEVRVGEGCRRTWVRLRDRKRSFSVSPVEETQPRVSLEWERPASGFLPRGEPARGPGPEPGLDPAERAKLWDGLRDVTALVCGFDPELVLRVCLVPLVSPGGVWLSLFPRDPVLGTGRVLDCGDVDEDEDEGWPGLFPADVGLLKSCCDRTGEKYGPPLLHSASRPPAPSLAASFSLHLEENEPGALMKPLCLAGAGAVPLTPAGPGWW